MPPIIEGPPEDGDPPRPLAKRLLWFAALLAGSALCTAAVAYALRAVLL